MGLFLNSLLCFIIYLVFLWYYGVCISFLSLLFLLLLSHSVVPNSLQPDGQLYTRISCPSSSPGDCSNSCPLRQWCHTTISSSVNPSPPALNLSLHQGLFQWVSFLHEVAKVLELQLQYQSFHIYSGLTSLGLTSLISLLPKGLARIFSSTSLKTSILWRSAFFMVQLLYPYMTTGKIIALTIKEGPFQQNGVSVFLIYYLDLS